MREINATVLNSKLRDLAASQFRSWVSCILAKDQRVETILAHFGTITNELEMTEYKYNSEALKEIASYIECYNVERIHSSLGN